MKLYDLTLSGHAHRARLAASLMGVEVDIMPVDFMAGEHKQPAFLAKNPFGQVPVLEDGDITITDSNAILVYLAKKYDTSNQWLPNDPQQAAEVQTWLSKAANELAHGPAAARLVAVFHAPLDLATTQQKANDLLAIFNQHLSGRDWFVGQHPTVADIAQYSYIAHVPEGGVDLSLYSNIKAWIKRFEALPGFTPMPETDTAEKAAISA